MKGTGPRDGGDLLLPLNRVAKVAMAERKGSRSEIAEQAGCSVIKTGENG